MINAEGVNLNTLGKDLLSSAIGENGNPHLMKFVKITSIKENDDSCTVILSVENLVIKEMCDRHLIAKLFSSLNEKFKKNIFFEYIINSSQESFAIDEQPTAAAADSYDHLQKAAASIEFKQKYALNRSMTFDSMIHTNENDFPIRALNSFITNPDLSFQSVFLHGSSGVGKSHLLNSVGWAFLSLHHSLKIKIVSGDEFINDFQTAIFTKTMADFRNKYRLKTDVLLIDDIHCIDKAKGTQNELFNLFNDYQHSGRKIILTSDRDISELKNLDERLKSRFLGGLVLNIDLPSHDSKKKYLIRKLNDCLIVLNPNVIDQILSNAGSCYRSLDGIICRLQMLKRLNGRIDESVTEKMFPRNESAIIESSGTESISSILIATANKFELTVAEIKGVSRKRKIVEARREVIFKLKNDLKMGVTDIGRLLGRDHATILNALGKR